jgi:hypothetical protein
MLKRILLTSLIFIILTLCISVPVLADGPSDPGVTATVDVNGDNSNVTVNANGDSNTVNVNGQNLDNLVNTNQLSFVAQNNNPNIYNPVTGQWDALSNILDNLLKDGVNIGDQITAINGTIAVLQAAQGTDSGHLNTTMEAVAKLIMQLGDLQASLATLQGGTTGNTSNIQKIQSVLVSLEGVLNDYIATNNQALQQTNNNLESQISDLHNQLNAQKNQTLADMKSAAALDQTRYDDLHSRYVLVRNILIAAVAVLAIGAIILSILTLKRFRNLELRLK